MAPVLSYRSFCISSSAVYALLTFVAGILAVLLAQKVRRFLVVAFARRPPPAAVDNGGGGGGPHGGGGGSASTAPLLGNGERVGTTEYATISGDGGKAARDSARGPGDRKAPAAGEPDYVSRRRNGGYVENLRFPTLDM